MKSHTNRLLRIMGFTAVAVLGIFVPFLPGRHDPVAWPISLTIQLLAAAAVLVSLIAFACLATEALASPKAGGRRPEQ